MRELMNIGLHNFMDDMLKAELIIVNGNVHKSRHGRNIRVNDILASNYPDATFHFTETGFTVMYPNPDRKIIIMSNTIQFQQIK
jgi:hypothetical protein